MVLVSFYPTHIYCHSFVNKSKIIEALGYNSMSLFYMKQKTKKETFSGYYLEIVSPLEKLEYTMEYFS